MLSVRTSLIGAPAARRYFLSDGRDGSAELAEVRACPSTSVSVRAA